MKRLLVTLVLIALIITSLTASVFSVAAESAEVEGSFDDSYVVDDLLTATVNGQPFDPGDFPAVAGAQPQILSFQEYGYSYYANENQDLFGLYIYVYNPGQKTISSTTRNKISIAVGYDESGKPNDYEKFTLVLCSRSADDYSNLYYKFRIADPSGKIKARVATTPLERRYDVAEIELDFGDDNAAAYGVGGTFRFTGYATGLGPADDTDDSTLRCDVTDLETITLDVHPTVWRSESSSAGAGHHNQLHSVYFAVEDRFFETYGALQKIKAMYYEMQLQPAIVTSSEEVYNDVKPHLGENIGEHSDSITYAFGADSKSSSGMNYSRLEFSWTYNVDLYSVTSAGYTSQRLSDSYSPYLALLFYTGSSNLEDYSVSIEELTNYIKNYDASHQNGDLDFLGGISADLFDLSKSKPNEATVIELDADNEDDKHDLMSYNDTHDFWDEVGDYGFWDALFGRVPDDESLVAIDPIVIVEEADLTLGKASLCEKYLINESDYDDFIAYANANKPDSKIVLFRYRVSDYVSKSVVTLDNEVFGDYTSSSYMFRQSIDLDFDIISLTFNKDGNYTVIAAVSDPINVIAPGDPPADYDDNGWVPKVKSWFEQLWDKIVELWNKLVAALGDFGTNWWKYLFVALAIIVGVPIAFYLIKTIVTLPWKLIKQHERNQRYNQNTTRGNYGKKRKR